MTQFIYKARDMAGLAINGSMEADDELAVVHNLGSLGYHVVHIDKQQVLWLELRHFFKRFQNVPQREIIIFARQLATMLKSGLTLISALDGIAQQVRDETLAGAIEGVRADIEGGSTFSDALGRYPQIFNTLFVSMIKVGETTGTLDQVLDRLVFLNTQEFDVRQRIRSALLYPAILVVAAVAIVSFLLVVIVPKFVVIFETYDAKLPLPTQILLWVSFMVSKFWLLFLIAVVAGGFWLKSYLKTEKGLYQFHMFLLKLPVIGDFYIKVIVSRFTRVLGMLIRSGIPILMALNITEQTVKNVVISKIIQGIHFAVAEGKSLAEPFKASGVFPPMVIQMIAAGETSGRIDQMLVDVATFYDQETEYTIKNITTTLEPVLLLVMGGIVAFIALSVLLPIFNLVQVFRNI